MLLATLSAGGRTLEGKQHETCWEFLPSQQRLGNKSADCVGVLCVRSALFYSQTCEMLQLFGSIVYLHALTF